jgi:hypothetical protein
MKLFISFFLSVLLFTTPALAGPACYSPAELEAEQLLRLHSELMVITVTCRTGSQGEDLVSAYTTFTKFNIKKLHDAEQTMIRYYEAHGAGNGIEHLDKLRTKLGNEYGQKSANMSAPLFCKEYRDKVLVYCHILPNQLSDEVQRMCTAERSYVPPCDAPGSVVAKKSQ